LIFSVIEKEPVVPVAVIVVSRYEYLLYHSKDILHLLLLSVAIEVISSPLSTGLDVDQRWDLLLCAVAVFVSLGYSVSPSPYPSSSRREEGWGIDEF
jgi:hypothetical protein